ncbi:MAG: ATP-grasp domain-containing protein [ANME-2 cluster archaeon]|nr:ATP-grasp domain-containing protein [ANME-2 cluster archaeon]
MNIMVAEYAVGTGESGTILLEGRAMLDVLVRSFVDSGHRVLYPTSGTILQSGTAVITDDLERTIEQLSSQCDAGLVVAPDELLGDLTELVEEHTVNLGCPSVSVRVCADKLECARILEKEGIQVPDTIISGGQEVFSLGDRLVLKPRWGCASEDTTLTRYSCATMIPEGFVATRFIEGQHLSASMVVGDTVLPLTVNKQHIKIGNDIMYDGGTVGIDCGRNDEIFEVAGHTARVLGCKGYVGIDIVLAEEPWVIDVNPRPTTSIIGIEKVMDEKLGELLLRAGFGALPERVSITGQFGFTKAYLKKGNID